jgi:hypothetical protein
MVIVLGRSLFGGGADDQVHSPYSIFKAAENRCRFQDFL